MKRSLLCIICLCFPLVVTSGEIKPIHHENCKIEIYSNFLKLKDFNKNPVEYTIKTVNDIVSLFTAKGYVPVAGFYPGIMSLDINSFLRKESQETETPHGLEDIYGDFQTEEFYCWDVTATITKSGGSPVYNNKYTARKNVESYDLISGETTDYSNKIMGDAFYYVSSSPTLDDDLKNTVMDMLDNRTASNYTQTTLTSVYNFIGAPLADSMEAVLLGASAETIKTYKEIPSNLGILKDIPYCCTPQNKKAPCN